MDPAVFILASASIPLLLHNIYWHRKEGKIEGIYGIIAGLFGFSGAFAIMYGFPGNLLIPITLGIITAGHIHAYLMEKERSSAVKSGIFAGITSLIVLLEVLL